jgi:phosphoenolpyruvate carboxykinase (GTP)
VDVDAALDRAGVTNDRVRAYVRQWAAHTRPDRVEVVSAADDAG